jgi:hypothetical protein
VPRRQEIQLVIRILPPLLKTTSLLVAVIALYAILGYALFQDVTTLTDDDKPYGMSRGRSVGFMRLELGV